MCNFFRRNRTWWANTRVCKLLCFEILVIETRQDENNIVLHFPLLVKLFPRYEIILEHYNTVINKMHNFQSCSIYSVEMYICELKYVYALKLYWNEKSMRLVIVVMFILALRGWILKLQHRYRIHVFSCKLASFGKIVPRMNYSMNEKFIKFSKNIIIFQIYICDCCFIIFLNF